MEHASRRAATALLNEPETGGQATLAESIAQVVRSRTGGQIRGLKVEVRSDGVRLQGRCASFYCKQLAQHVAMGLAGDAALSNDIEVS